MSFAPRRAARWTRLAFATLLTLSAASTACVRNSKPDEDAEPAPTTYLKVENRAFLDMTMYVLRNSQRVRLGVATGNTTTKLVIPNTLLYSGSGTLQFLANPIGGRRSPVSQEISVSAGDEVTLLIPPS
jgi:hypothetical protein